MNEIIFVDDYFDTDDSDYESDSELSVSDYEHIYELEADYLDAEKYDGEYVIGISSSCNVWNGELFSSAVTNRTFFRFPYDEVLKYLYYYSVFHIRNPKIEIIQIYILNEAYITVKKTYWLKLIQRHWRKVITEKKRIMMKRGNIVSMNHFAVRGRWPEGLNSFPRLKGMLSCYKNSLVKSK